MLNHKSLVSEDADKGNTTITTKMTKKEAAETISISNVLLQLGNVSLSILNILFIALSGDPTEDR